MFVNLFKNFFLTKTLTNMLPFQRGMKFSRIWVDNPFRVYPDQLNIAFTGSTYDTKLKRKRKVEDINRPLLERGAVECLKWSDWKMLRDLRRRYIYCHHYPLKVNLNCIKRNQVLPEVIRVCLLYPLTMIRF